MLEKWRAKLWTMIGMHRRAMRIAIKSEAHSMKAYMKAFEDGTIKVYIDDDPKPYTIEEAEAKGRADKELK